MFTTAMGARAKRTIIIGTALIAALPVMSSCGDESADIGPLITVSGPADLRLPLDSYMPTQAEARSIASARDVLTARCMDRFGFEFPVPDRSGSYGELPNSRRYGIVDMQHASQFGYKPDPEVVIRTKKIVNSNNIPRDAAAVWLGERTGGGIPAGGCKAEAMRNLSGRDDAVELQQFVDELAHQSYNLSKTEPRVKKATSEWANCMEQRGHTYELPSAAESDPAWGRSGSSSGDKEKRTARDDVDCKFKTNLAATWLTVETAHQKKIIEENDEKLRVARKTIDKQIQVASGTATPPAP